MHHHSSSRRLTVTVPSELAEKIRLMAVAEHRSLDAQMRWILSEYMDAEEDRRAEEAA
jgi:plasmid stability protein